MKSVRFGTTDLKASLTDPLTGEVSDFYALTALFRNQDLFPRLAKEIIRRFPEGVPVHCYAASDGSEAYTTAIHLMKEAGVEASKKYPISAFDINAGLMAQAKKALIKIFQRDLAAYIELQKQGFKLKFPDFFERQPDAATVGNKVFHPQLGEEIGVFKVKDPLVSCVKFDVRDIRQAAKIRQEQPVVLMFRNAWYQLGKHSKQASIELARNLFRNLAPGSLLVIGESEEVGWHLVDVPGILRQTGFLNIPVGRMWDDADVRSASLIFEKP